MAVLFHGGKNLMGHHVFDAAKYFAGTPPKIGIDTRLDVIEDSNDQSIIIG